MEEVLLLTLKKISEGNIPVIILITLVIVGIILYSCYLIFKHTTDQNNNSTASQVENSINLIIQLIKEIQSKLNSSIISINENIKDGDEKILSHINNLEVELTRSIESLEHKLITLINTNNFNLINSVNNNVSESFNDVDVKITKDLSDIRIQRKEIKDSLESNIRDVKYKIDQLSDLLKNASLDNSSTTSRINQTLESLKHSIDITNLMNNSVRLQPLKTNVSEE